MNNDVVSFDNYKALHGKFLKALIILERCKDSGWRITHAEEVEKLHDFLEESNNFVLPCNKD